ncbi:MAG: CDP-alcohol phosphatidyltransferase family protein [Chloroflexi bacterium]|nr:CDP-alcohol phosphatidyltransferase family protein [Chloroflexota bacterium]
MGRSKALRALRVRWLAYAGLSALAMLAAASLLAGVETAAYAGRWAAQAGLVMAYELWAVWVALPENMRPEEEDLLARLGWGNILTLGRGTLIALLAGFLLLPRPAGGWAWLPAGIYILSDFTDFFDGYLARRGNHATRLGERLDMNHDSLGVLTATLLAFQYGTVPWWYALFGFARYFFVFGLWSRRRRGLPVFDLPPNPSRRVFAALQMGLVTAMLFPIFGPPATTVAATLFMIPFVAGFAYDWLHVSGRLAAPATDAGRVWDKVWAASRDQLPLLFRAMGALVLLAWAAQPETRLAQPWQTLETLGILGIGLGLAARFFSVTSLLLLGARFAAFGGSPAAWALMAACIGVVFLGPGKWYLWGPEEWFVRNRAGERRSA